MNCWPRLPGWLNFATSVFFLNFTGQVTLLRIKCYSPQLTSVEVSYHVFPKDSRIVRWYCTSNYYWQKYLKAAGLQPRNIKSWKCLLSVSVPHTNIPTCHIAIVPTHGYHFGVWNWGKRRTLIFHQIHAVTYQHNHGLKQNGYSWEIPKSEINWAEWSIFSMKGIEMWTCSTISK